MMQKFHISRFMLSALPKERIYRHALQDTLASIIVQPRDFSPFPVDKTLLPGYYLK
jgi:hypothetical protein